MMESLLKAIQLNNKGVLQMDQDNEANNAGSFDAFQMAVDQLKFFAATCREPPLKLPASLSLSTPLPLSFSGDNQAGIFSERSSRFSTLQTGPFFVYDRAIIVPSRTSSTLGCHTTDAMAHVGYMTHISVLFNLALLQHKRAAYCNDDLDRTESRKRAYKLYNWVVRTIDETSDRTESLDLDVLKCLVLNNCAVVHFELGQFASSRRRFKDVELQLLMVNVHLQTFLEDVEADGIRYNSKQAALYANKTC